MEKYVEMKRRHEKEINEFPLGFAFSNAQFDEMCEKLGVKNPQDELFSLGMGGYVRKVDAEKYNALVSKINSELRKGFEDFDFSVGAFKYELGNHEYCITCDTEDTIYSLGLLPSEVEKSEHLSKALREAIRLYWEDQE